MTRLVLGRAIAAGLLTLAVVLQAGPAAANEKVETYIKRLAGQIMEAAANPSKAAFRPLVRKHADVPAIAKRAAGRYGRGLSGAERAAMNRAVEEMITQSFVKNAGWLTGKSLEVRAVSDRDNGGVQVTTQILDGVLDEVKWRLVRKAGGFKVSDINVAGIWLSLQMKSVLLAKLKNARGDVMAALSE